MEVFRARRSRAAWIGLIAGVAILLAPVIAILVDPPEAGFWTPHWILIFPAAIFGFFVYVLIASACKMFTAYRVLPEGIRIRVPPFHDRLFHRQDILQVQLLSDKETHELITQSLEEQNRFSGSADIAGYLRMIRKKAPEFRYFTIAPMVTLKGSGRREAITSVSAPTTGGSVLLRLRSGKRYYLTPENAVGFRQAAGAMGLGVTGNE
jgi:hypothetical protein